MTSSPTLFTQPKAAAASPRTEASDFHPDRRSDSLSSTVQVSNLHLQFANFFGHSLLSPFRMVCRDFILPEPASYVLFYVVSNLRKLLDLLTKAKILLETHSVSSRTVNLEIAKDGIYHPLEV